MAPLSAGLHRCDQLEEDTVDKRPLDCSLNRRRFLGVSLEAASAAGFAAGNGLGALAQEAASPVPSAGLNKNFGNIEIRIATIAEYYAYAFRMFQDQVEQELGVRAGSG